MNTPKITPIITDESGDWYSMKDMSALMQRTPERVRQLCLVKNPSIIKDKSRGIILYRLADGWVFLERGGIRQQA
jgi:hypothetical protein